MLRDVRPTKVNQSCPPKRILLPGSVKGTIMLSVGDVSQIDMHFIVFTLKHCTYIDPVLLQVEFVTVKSTAKAVIYRITPLKTDAKL